MFIWIIGIKLACDSFPFKIADLTITIICVLEFLLLKESNKTAKNLAPKELILSLKWLCSYFYMGFCITNSNVYIDHSCWCLGDKMKCLGLNLGLLYVKQASSPLLYLSGSSNDHLPQCLWSHLTQHELICPLFIRY